MYNAVGGLTGAVRPEEIQESFARAGATVEGVELMRDADGASVHGSDWIDEIGADFVGC